jgi:hypothetical protein
MVPAAHCGAVCAGGIGEATADRGAATTGEITAKDLAFPPSPADHSPVAGGAVQPTPTDKGRITIY